MRPSRPTHLLIAALALITGCGKNDEPPNTAPSGPPSLFPHLSVSQDSSCLATGNVFTPNADGINDRLYISAINVTDVQVTLRWPNGTLIYSGGLDGLDNDTILPAPTSNQAPFRLSLTCSGIATSGDTLSDQAWIYTATDLEQHCFSDAVAPVFPDQFIDLSHLHLTCGPESPTNDLVCIQ